MNRRRFLKLGTIGLGAAAAVAVLPKIAASLPPILNPEVPATTYSTYIIGQDALLCAPLTVADIRKCVEQLKSREIKPVNGMIGFPVHPNSEVMEWVRYKYQWNVAAS